MIPHNYKESSYPVCVFVWTIENLSSEAAEVAIMFTHQNGIGRDSDLGGSHKNIIITSEQGTPKNHIKKKGFSCSVKT